MLEKIGALSPSRFENLTYDLVKAVGLKNATWRTPGADGGRDIEGIAYVRDLSGYELTQRWYVECKRYSSSIDWPTMWGKISYADVQNADVLLLVTNSNPSPVCETKIQEWNASKRRPVIRVWRGYDLDKMLAVHTSVAVVHGLKTDPATVNAAALPLALVISKTTQAAFSTYLFDGDAGPALECASLLSELLSKRLSDLARYGKSVHHKDSIERIQFDWLDVSGDLSAWDTVALKATVSMFRHIASAKNASIISNTEEVTVIFSGNKFEFSNSLPSDMDVVSEWSRIGYVVTGPSEVRLNEIRD